MNFYIGNIHAFCLFFIISSTPLHSSDPETLKSWHEKQAPCPPNSPVSLHNFRSERIINSALLAALQYDSSSNTNNHNGPSLIPAALQQLNKDEATLKKKSQDVFIKSCATKTLGVLLTGAAIYHGATTKTSSHRIFVIDDLIGASVAKAVIQPLCCAVLGAFTLYNVDRWIFGTVREQIQIHQQQLNGLKTQLTSINSTVLQLKENDSQRSLKLSQIIPQLEVTLKNVEKMKETIEADYKQHLQSELDSIAIPTEETMLQASALETTAQATFKNNKKNASTFGFIKKLLGSDKKTEE